MRNPMFIQRSTARQAACAAMIALTLVNAAGCTTWQPIKHPTPQQFTAKPRTIYGIVPREGKALKVDRVVMRNDSVFGNRVGKPNSVVGFALRDVRAINQEKPDGVKLLFGGVIVAAVYAAVATALREGLGCFGFGCN